MLIIPRGVRCLLIEEMLLKETFIIIIIRVSNISYQSYVFAYE